MRAVVTRVKNARIEIDKSVYSAIGAGLLILLGVGENDAEEDAKYLAGKVKNLRIFEDENGKMNMPPEKASAQMMVVSNFTLFGNCRSRRPDFLKAARPEVAVPLYNLFVSELKVAGFETYTGEFGADMQVFSQNDGPVTLWLDTEELKRTSGRVPI